MLIIDDNRDAADSLGVLLELHGLQVAVCHDASEGRDHARSERFDVILLDLDMPTLDGYQVARDLRAQGASRDATLVAVTGHGRAEDHRRTAEAGFDAHLVKPVSLVELQRWLGGGDASLAADPKPAP